jgi:hypothetical protein
MGLIIMRALSSALSYMRIKTRVRTSLFVVVIVFAFALAAPAQRPPDVVHSAVPTDQGCVNQGSDRREFAPVVCWMQRHMSWKSEHEPHFALIGRPNGTSLGLAWPPYTVFNLPDGDGHWRMFRLGFRYDRTWRGYIFPTIAAKRISQPLRY